MQHSSAGLRPAGRRVAAVVAAGAVALGLFAGAWASTHELVGSAFRHGDKLAVVKKPAGGKFAMSSGRKL